MSKKPTTDFITIETDLDIKFIDFFDSIGKHLETTNEKTINLQPFETGFYILTIEATDGSKGSFKVMKK
ncbi:T9SS type A sorting domain-containing protein [Capnocytophaga sp. ARDL2]|uniref:T9SS type A sorting domain-containing protein n=1 Tax=Capnocytophaga sp. ARDL2 TaxID=3238809 RepID=UPI0035585F9B